MMVLDQLSFIADHSSFIMHHLCISPMMKQADLRLFSFLLLFGCSTVFCQAQHAFGLSGGGGFTQAMGFRMALPLEFNLSKHVFLFGGPAYLQRRNMELVRKLPVSREYRSAEINYLSLPVLLKVRLDWEPIRIYGLAGIELNYGVLINANGIEDQRLFKERIEFADIAVDRLDGGFCIGAGFETDLHRQRKIFADLRHYLGVLDIDPSADGEIYNEGTFVTLGFMLPLGAADTGKR